MWQSVSTKESRWSRSNGGSGASGTSGVAGVTGVTLHKGVDNSPREERGPSEADVTGQKL